MFARIKKSGKYEYLLIVHNERTEGSVRQRTIANLGRLDVLRQNGQLEGLTASLAKLCGSHRDSVRQPRSEVGIE